MADLITIKMVISRAIQTVMIMMPPLMTVLPKLGMLLQNPIFEGLAPSDFEGVELLWEIRRLSGDEFLWYQGQPAHELAIVTSGSLKAQINDQVLGVIQQGELVGEL